jgi:hypothetical protein
MEQPEFILENGVAVVTCPGFVAGSADGMMVPEEYKTNRSARTNGKIVAAAGGHGGDVYLVRHDLDGKVAAYCYTEFVLVGVNGAANRVQAPVQE